MSWKNQLDANIKRMCGQLDSIEELLKLSLANSLLDDLDLATPRKIEDKKQLSDDIAVQPNEKGLYECGHFCFFDKMVIELECRKTLTARELINIHGWLAKELGNAIPLFCFSQLNGMKRKRMQEEKISFRIGEKEIHIVAV